MDLRSFQRQMCLTLKKYLEKAVEREYLELLREIISIHESQKSVISALRGVKSTAGDSSSSCGTSPSPPSSRGNRGPQPFQSAQLESSPKDGKAFDKVKAEDDGEELGEKIDLDFISEEGHGFKLFPFGTNSQLGFLKCAAASNLNPVDFMSSADGAEKDEETPPLSPWQEKENLEDDIHDLVTAYEFMQSLGLLTIKECQEVLKKRRERHKKNALSHVFCQAIWEKQETKRKKRDWLLSSSPPQLRRKIRPGSHPPSRQPSRPSSPAEGGSSSPTSSLSPPSPASLGSYNQNSQSNNEICLLCKEKGASYQCDGCGVLYHSSCVDCLDEESDYFSEWLCPKCERLGLRTSSYTDPLHQGFPKEDLTKKDHPLICKAEQTQTKKGKNQGDERPKDFKKRNVFQIRKYVSFPETRNLIDCSTNALSLAPSLYSLFDASSNTLASPSFRTGTLKPRSIQTSLSTSSFAAPLPKSSLVVPSSSQMGEAMNKLIFCSAQNMTKPQESQRSLADEDWLARTTPALTGSNEYRTDDAVVESSESSLACFPFKRHHLSKHISYPVILQYESEEFLPSSHLEKRNADPPISVASEVDPSSSFHPKEDFPSAYIPYSSNAFCQEKFTLECLPDLIGRSC